MSAEPTNGQSNIDVILKAIPSHANTLTPKTIRRWLACWAASILLVAPAAFFWGWISAQREQSNRLAATLAEAPQIAPWVAAHGGWATFHPTKDEKGNLFHTLVIHLPGTDVGTNVAGDGFMNFPD